MDNRKSLGELGLRVSDEAAAALLQPGNDLIAEERNYPMEVVQETVTVAENALTPSQRGSTGTRRDRQDPSI